MTGGTVALDQATITLIIQLLVEVIQLYQGCNKSQETAFVSMQKPNFFDRWRFRRLAKKRFGNDATVVVSSAYTIGKTLTLDDVYEMYATVPAIFFE